MKNADIKKLNKANELMNKAINLLREVNKSDDDFRHGIQGTLVISRLSASIGQLECIDFVKRISNE